MLSEAGGGDWDDPVKINFLEMGLNEAMKDALVYIINMPEKFPEYCHSLGLIANNLAARKPGHARSQKTQQNTYSNQNFHATSSGASASVTKDGTSVTVRSGSPDAMEWTKTNEGTRAKWVS